MDIQNSEYFYYKDGRLFCEEIDAAEIAASTGTPVFIYSKKFFTDSYTKFTEAFKDLDHKIFYACKSNFNVNVIKIFADLGSGVDVNSEGELQRALKAGVKPVDMILSGVGKTEAEIRSAVEKDLFVIKAESEEEIVLINKIATELKKQAMVSLRINPDIHVKTHPYITTGLIENKFGLNSDKAAAIFKDKKKFPNINFTGLDMHIGSQITETAPYIKAVQKILDIHKELKKSGINISHFDFGGGFGIKYKDESIFEPEELASEIMPYLKQFECQILFEPGRFLTANAGLLITKILYMKSGERKKFIIADAAMTDIIRPSLYGTYHHIQPLDISKNRKDITADVVGPVCETGDFLAKGRIISEVKSGEYLAVLSAGAYGSVMSSNYNARTKPPEVIVDKNKFYITRSRESIEHMLYDEKIIPEL